MGKFTKELDRFTGKKDIQNEMQRAAESREKKLKEAEAMEKKREAQSKQEDEQSKAEKQRDDRKRRQRMASGGKGRGSTILTSDLGEENTDLESKKTLLGE